MSASSDLRGKWLVMGHYGAGNAGDEAMRQGLLAALPSDVRARMVVVSRDATADPGTAGRLPLAPAVLLRALPRVEGVILGGGTHFHDEYGGRSYFEHLRSMLRHLGVYALTRLLGGTVLWIGVGVGPLRRRPARLLFRAAAGTCDLIAVRDRASFERCRALLPDRRLRAVVRTTFDLAALLPAPRAGRDRRSGRIVLGVSVMNLEGFRGFGPEAAAEAHGHIARALGERLVEDESLEIRIFITGQSRRENDRDISCRLWETLESTAPGRTRLVEHMQDPERALERVAACDAVFATRYHALLFGYMCGCRLAALAYNEKVADLGAELGLAPEALIHPDGAVDGPRVVETLRGLVEGGAGFTPRLPLDQARERARRSIALLIDAIGGDDPSAHPETGPP